jgi:glycosyltransferase involved in cell wall biosynthesis
VKKLIIQIPCLNEAEMLPETIPALPRKVVGFDIVEFMVIDDGSTDGTSETARKLGVDHILRFPQNRGLAMAFNAGLDAAINLGADCVVNTDADNQYHAGDIPELVKPILEGKADIVIGDRQTDKIGHFSPTKKVLQKFGSWMVRVLSTTDVTDATSGFRAFSREAAMRIHVTSTFTYTLESIISAGQNNLSIASVPVRTNAPTRPSRLFKTIGTYVRRSGATMLRIWLMYEPLKLFFYLGSLLFLTGFALGVRFLCYFFFSDATGKVQSLILAAVLIILGFQMYMIGIVADLIANSRRMVEDVLYRVRRMQATIAPSRDLGNPVGDARKPEDK